jgi:hypothetical protein
MAPVHVRRRRRETERRPIVDRRLAYNYDGVPLKGSPQIKRGDRFGGRVAAEVVFRVSMKLRNDRSVLWSGEA